MVVVVVVVTHTRTPRRQLAFSSGNFLLLSRSSYVLCLAFVCDIMRVVFAMDSAGPRTSSDAISACEPEGQILCDEMR